MNLLLAIDESAAAELAIEAVQARPWPNDTRLRVLSVAPQMLGMSVAGVPVAGSSGTMSPLLEADQVEAQNILLDQARMLAERTCSRLSQHLPCEPRWRLGTAGVEIVSEAEAWPADLIVLGSRGLGAIKRALLGSVSTHVLHHAPCSIEVVRARASDRA